MSPWLTQEELVMLTGYSRHTKQRVVLAKMGIAFRSRENDHFPLVERAQFEQVRAYNRRRSPNMTAVN